MVSDMFFLIANYIAENDMVIYSFNSGNSDITAISGSKALSSTQTVRHKVNVFHNIMAKWVEYCYNLLSLHDLLSYWKVVWDYIFLLKCERCGACVVWEKQPLNVCCRHVEANSPLVTHVNNGLFYFDRVKYWKTYVVPAEIEERVFSLQSPFSTTSSVWNWNWGKNS